MKTLTLREADMRSPVQLEEQPGQSGQPWSKSLAPSVCSWGLALQGPVGPGSPVQEANTEPAADTP